MTCIVGIARDGRVVIGGDSAGVDSRYQLTVRSDQKVFRAGPIIAGFTTSFRMGQLLRYSLKVPERQPEQDVFEFMATAFVDAVRKTLRDGGYATKKDEVESAGVFLVGYAGRLFQIQSDYQVSENAAGFDACGCADGIALGAVDVLLSHYELNKGAVPLLYVVNAALQAAERWSAGVRGPFTIIDSAEECEKGVAASCLST